MISFIRFCPSKAVDFHLCSHHQDLSIYKHNYPSVQPQSTNLLTYPKPHEKMKFIALPITITTLILATLASTELVRETRRSTRQSTHPKQIRQTSDEVLVHLWYFPGEQVLDAMETDGMVTSVSLTEGVRELGWLKDYEVVKNATIWMANSPNAECQAYYDREGRDAAEAPFKKSETREFTKERPIKSLSCKE